MQWFLGPICGYLLITTTGACIFVVFDHSTDMSRSHHLIIWNTILDYYCLADVLEILKIIYLHNVTSKFCPIAPPSARVHLAAVSRKNILPVSKIANSTTSTRRHKIMKPFIDLHTIYHNFIIPRTPSPLIASIMKYWNRFYFLGAPPGMGSPLLGLGPTSYLTS